MKAHRLWPFRCRGCRARGVIVFWRGRLKLCPECVRGYLGESKLEFALRRVR